jgi:nucleoside-diphosphate-sugar epimerase
MKLAIVGSEGFIGRELVRRARLRGAAVTLLDSAADGESGALPVDIRDRRALIGALPPGLDAVVHLAAITRDADCAEHPDETLDVNVAGTQNVIDAVVEKGARQLIFASSELVYGNVHGRGAQLEDQPIDMQRLEGLFALTKLMGERLIAIAHHQGRLRNAAILRFAIVYGPRAADWSEVETLFHAVASEREAHVGSVLSARRFIHVSDVADGILAAAGRTGIETFNLSGDRLITLGEIIRRSAQIHGSSVRAAESAPTTVSVRNPDNAKAHRLLQWAPHVTLEEGLRTLL